MKQTLLLAAICIGLVLCAVGYSDSKYHTALGRMAPDFYAVNNYGDVSAASLKGGYSVLNFWSSADAPSREAANVYTAWQRRNPDSDLRLVSVNFDKNDALFNEIVRLDSLNPADQYHVSGDTAKAIIDNYGLKDGFGSLLIDPTGKIVAHNPDAEQLSSIVVGSVDQ